VSVAIIGGGVVGLTSAWYLAKTGEQVTVIDRGRIGHGASYANTGLITPSLAVPLSAPGSLYPSLRLALRRDSPLRISASLSPDFIRW
jgi:D-amino-acid dehydrogenase